MKRIMNAILLIGVLLIVGCSKEDAPQSVSFEVKELAAETEGGLIYVNVIANCPWTISDNSREVSVESSKGEGNASVRIDVTSNDKYDKQTYQVTLTSEDGTSSDKLTITQDEKKALFIDKLDKLLSEKGDTFSIHLKTNDEIKVECQDWIKVTSSRALSKQIFYFEAEANKTGSPREGWISFKGSKASDKILIKQDSYTPTNAYIPNLPERSETDSIVVDVVIEPEYADWNKVSLCYDFEGRIKKLEDKKLSVKLDIGFTSIELKAGDKTTYSGSILYWPGIKITPKVGWYSLSYNSILERKICSIDFEIEIRDFALMEFEHWKIKDKNGNVLIDNKGDERTLPGGGVKITTDIITFEIDSYKEEVKNLVFELKVKPMVTHVDLGPEIYQEKIILPENWD